MRKSFVLLILPLMLCFPFTLVAQQSGSIKSSVDISFPEKNQKTVFDPLPPGTYTIGSGGYFPTIDSAFNKLSNDGIDGEVVLEINK